MDAGFLQFAKEFGLPFALVLFALVTGAMGRWYFGSVVTKLEALYKERLDDKDEQITALQEAAKLDAQTSHESLRLVQQAIDALARIERRLDVQAAGAPPHQPQRRVSR